MGSRSQGTGKRVGWHSDGLQRLSTRQGMCPTRLETCWRRRRRVNLIRLTVERKRDGRRSYSSGRLVGCRAGLLVRSMCATASNVGPESDSGGLRLRVGGDLRASRVDSAFFVVELAQVIHTYVWEVLQVNGGSMKKSRSLLGSCVESLDTGILPRSGH